VHVTKTAEKTYTQSNIPIKTEQRKKQEQVQLIKFTIYQCVSMSPIFLVILLIK
jgi:hypothetical protein